MSGGVEIPFDQLSPETLDAVIESFVLREGTDYGAVEVSLKSKVAAVRRQLVAGEVKILFDPEDESLLIENSQRVK